jgi:hypothetical protein
MLVPSEQQLIADATDFVLDRLDAWRAGDHEKVAELDAAAPKDPLAMTAMWSAAFGIAERCYNVIGALDPEELQRTMQSFRKQAEEVRLQ